MRISVFTVEIIHDMQDKVDADQIQESLMDSFVESHVNVYQANEILSEEPKRKQLEEERATRRAKKIIKSFLTAEITMHKDILGEEEAFALNGFEDLTVKDIEKAFELIF